MLLRTSAWLLFAAALIWTATDAGRVRIVDARAVEAEAVERLQSAVETQSATRARLRVLGDASACEVARFLSYRRSDADPETVDHWYVTSQLWADAILLDALADHEAPATARLPGNISAWAPSDGWDEPNAQCHLERGFVFLDRLWDYEAGGYYPRSNLTGTSVERETRYADDNALAGLVLLAAAEQTPDAAAQRRYLHAAEDGAEFLVNCGLWDATFGGGFWWTTDKGATFEGKPAQTNALAALLFGRLYAATGQESYREWALRTLLWMDTILYDQDRKLYRWSVRYEDPVQRTGAVLADRYFNYDQAIAIEAQLLASQLDGDPAAPRDVRTGGRDGCWTAPATPPPRPGCSTSRPRWRCASPAPNRGG